MKAYLIHEVQAGKVTYPASTPSEPSVAEFSEAEFERLEAAGAVRKATEDEINAVGANQTVIEGEVSPAGEKPAKATGKAKADTKSDDLGV